MTYKFDPINSVIHLRASGVLVPGDPINYFRTIDKDPAFKPKAEERIYFTDLDDIKFSFVEVLSIRDAFESNGHGEKISHGVFIVDSDLSFGMARMVMTVFDGIFDNFTVERIG